MTRLKISTPIPDSVDASQAPSASNPPPVALVTPEDTMSASSPARDLQASLADLFLPDLAGTQAFEAYPEPVVEKMPFKWTLIGATFVCAAVWAGVYFIFS